MKVLFPDTNLFLQCKPIKQLPWEDISKHNILLLISRAVQDEIDNLKQSGNSRKAKRARIATSLFRQILKVNNIIIRQDKPHAEISFSPPVNQDNLSDYNLNLSRIDDQIVFEALIYRKNHKKCDVALLTHDTGPAVTAKSVGLPCILIPDEWLLPPETDSRDKRISELERKIKELERAIPKIHISYFDQNQNRIDSLSATLVEYPPISSAQLNNLMGKMKSKFPLITNFESQPSSGKHSQIQIMGFLKSYYQPSEEQIQQYRENDYPKWLVEVEKFFSSLHSKLEQKYRCIDLVISLSNVGNVPAENIVVEFTLHQGLLLPPTSEFVDEDESPKDLSIILPSPPHPPKGKGIQMGGVFPQLGGLTGYPTLPTSLLKSIGREPHDKHKFYWKPYVPHEKTGKWMFECDEFRHKVEPEYFNLSIHFPPEFVDKKTALECVITAKNLPEPHKHILPINLEYSKCDTISYALSLLDNIPK